MRCECYCEKNRRHTSNHSFAQYPYLSLTLCACLCGCLYLCALCIWYMVRFALCLVSTCVCVCLPRKRATLYYYHFKLRAKYKSLCTKANLPVHSRLHCNYITQTNLDCRVSKWKCSSTSAQVVDYYVWKSHTRWSSLKPDACIRSFFCYENVGVAMGGKNLRESFERFKHFTNVAQNMKITSPVLILLGFPPFSWLSLLSRFSVSFSFFFKVRKRVSIFWWFYIYTN